MSESLDLPARFHDWAAQSIDEAGVYPQLCMSIDEHGKLIMGAMALSADQVYRYVKTLLVVQAPVELIFGLDRTTRPNQGTEFADVLTCGWWARGRTVDPWRIGVINYQHAPRIVRDWDWDNSFWRDQMLRELRQGKLA